LEARARATSLWLLTAPPEDPAAVTIDALLQERQAAIRALHADLQRWQQASALLAEFRPSQLEQ